MKSYIHEIQNQLKGMDLLIYQTGSRLTGTNNANSDIDLYIFYIPSKLGYLIKTHQNRSLKGNGWEGKVFPISHLINLIIKSNPNVMEFLMARPVLISLNHSLIDFALFLYHHRAELLSIDRRHFVEASIGMIKQHKSKLQPSTTFNGCSSFGKIAYNLDKAYRYGKAVGLSQDFSQAVFLKGNRLQQKIRLKSINRFSDKEFQQLQIRTDKKIQELLNILSQLPQVQNLGLIKQIVQRVPVFDSSKDGFQTTLPPEF